MHNKTLKEKIRTTASIQRRFLVIIVRFFMGVIVFIAKITVGVILGIRIYHIVSLNRKRKVNEFKGSLY
jgi:hypothetical protein